MTVNSRCDEEVLRGLIKVYRRKEELLRVKRQDLEAELRRLVQSRTTFPGWWCSDHASPEELKLREIALQNLQEVTP